MISIKYSINISNHPRFAPDAGSEHLEAIKVTRAKCYTYAEYFQSQCQLKIIPVRCASNLGRYSLEATQ